MIIPYLRKVNIEKFYAIATTTKETKYIIYIDFDGETSIEIEEQFFENLKISLENIDYDSEVISFGNLLFNRYMKDKYMIRLDSKSKNPIINKYVEISIDKSDIMRIIIDLKILLGIYKNLINKEEGE